MAARTTQGHADGSLGRTAGGAGLAVFDRRRCGRRHADPAALPAPAGTSTGGHRHRSRGALDADRHSARPHGVQRAVHRHLDDRLHRPGNLGSWHCANESKWVGIQ